MWMRTLRAPLANSSGRRVAQRLPRYRHFERLEQTVGGRAARPSPNAAIGDRVKRLLDGVRSNLRFDHDQWRLSAEIAMR